MPLTEQQWSGLLQESPEIQGKVLAKHNIGLTAQQLQSLKLEAPDVQRKVYQKYNPVTGTPATTEQPKTTTSKPEPTVESPVGNTSTLTEKPVTEGMAGSKNPNAGIVGLAEAVPAMATGLPAFLVGTLGTAAYGVVNSLKGIKEPWYSAMEKTNKLLNRFTYSPKTPEGQKATTELTYGILAYTAPYLLPLLGIGEALGSETAKKYVSRENLARLKTANNALMIAIPSLKEGLAKQSVTAAKTELNAPAKIGSAEQSALEPLAPSPKAAEMAKKPTGTEAEIVTAGELRPGDTFARNGEVFTVKSVNDAGNVQAEKADGMAITIPKGKTIITDKGSVKLAPPVQAPEPPVAAKEVEPPKVQPVAEKEPEKAPVQPLQKVTPKQPVLPSAESAKKSEIAPIAESDHPILKDLQSMIAGMEAPGKLLPNGQRSRSTLPKALQGIGILKSDYDVIDKILKGESVTPKQQEKISGIVNEYKVMMGETGEHDFVKGEEFAVGDKFTMRGENFKVMAVDPETGEAIVKNGVTHKVPPTEDFPVDKGSYKPAEKGEEMAVPFSRKKAEESKNLVMVHNLSADNLKNVLKMKGMAVPSLAVIDLEKSKFDSFGDITLISNKEQFAPETSRENKFFNADVYSPRYPQITHFLTEKSRKSLNDYLDPIWKSIPAAKDTQGGISSHYVLESNIHDRGVEQTFAEGDPLLYYAFLKDKNALPKGVDRSWEGKQKVVKAVDKIGKAKYETWAKDKIKALGIEADEKIFNGFTYSGKKRYLPHDLDTVVKILKKDLKDGEGFNYGVGSLRAATSAKQFRSIKQMQEARGKIVSPEDMAKLKEEVDAEFLKIADNLIPSLKYKRGFGDLDAVTEHIKEAVETRNFSKVFGTADKDGEYYTAGVDTKPIFDFLNKLQNMPTEYFEGKIQRAVGLDEFNTAVVPNDLPAGLKQELKNKGLNVVEYKKGDVEDRKAKLAEASRERGLNFALNKEKLREPYKLASAAKDIQHTVSTITSRIPTLKDKVVVVKSEAELPSHLQAESKSRGYENTVEGVFDPKTGKTYLVSDNIAGKERAERVLAHEFTHKGIRNVLGDRIKPMFKQIYDQFKDSPEMQKVIKDYSLDAGKEGNRLTAVDEFIARHGEAYQKQPVIQRLISMIRHELRKMGFKISWSDKDIMNLAGAALKKEGMKEVRFSIKKGKSNESQKDIRSDNRTGKKSED